MSKEFLDAFRKSGYDDYSDHHSWSDLKDSWMTAGSVQEFHLESLVLINRLLTVRQMAIFFDPDISYETVSTNWRFPQYQWELKNQVYASAQSPTHALRVLVMLWVSIWTLYGDRLTSMPTQLRDLAPYGFGDTDFRFPNSSFFENEDRMKLKERLSRKIGKRKWKNGALTPNLRKI